MKFFKFVVKPLFFIGVAYCIFCFGSCSADRKDSRSETNYEELTQEVEKLKEENAEMRNNMNQLVYSISPTYDIPSAPAESAPSATTTVQTVTAPTSASEVYVTAVDVSIPQISKENEKPYATLVYSGQSFKLTPYSEENRESIKDLQFPYYGTSNRDATVIFSGITINGVYKVKDGSFEAISGVKYDYVDNTYIFPIHADGKEVNIYMVQTVNGSHFYFGVTAGNNK